MLLSRPLVTLLAVVFRARSLTLSHVSHGWGRRGGGSRLCILSVHPRARHGHCTCVRVADPGCSVASQGPLWGVVGGSARRSWVVTGEGIMHKSRDAGIRARARCGRVGCVPPAPGKPRRGRCATPVSSPLLRHSARTLRGGDIVVSGLRLRLHASGSRFVHGSSELRTGFGMVTRRVRSGGLLCQSG